jgi:dolichyl-phosphate beta-glucosyltransferase
MTKADLLQPFLSIVVPAYNESRRLGSALEQIRSYVEGRRMRAEVIVVDDGSSDGTSEVVERFDTGALPVRLLRNVRNRGKGYAVRRGMRKARGQVLLMTDADQSTPIGEIEKLLPHFESGFEVVIGSRDHPESDISTHQGLVRRLLGVTLRALRRWIMLRDICDTQCGFKIFTQEAARRIFAAQRVHGFLFDCEVLLLARQMGYRIREVGVTWCNDPDSRVRAVRDSLRMLVSLVLLRWRFRHVRTSPPPAPAPPDGST